MKPVLQVALDLMHRKRAMEIAKEAVAGGADWIEAGTPLIKSEGVEVIRDLKRTFPGHIIVADMKTMDVGAFEVEIAVKAGADVVNVMGLADDATIGESVLAARKYGAKIMVDLMNVPDKLGRAKTAERLGAGLVCLHVGIDEQMRGAASPIELVRTISAQIGVPLAVAGGITPARIGELVRAGASVLIVGGSIIKNENVEEATRAIKQALLDPNLVQKELIKKYSQSDLMEAFARVSMPNIADAQHKKGVMLGLSPHIKHGQRMVGRVLTVQTAKGDWAKPVEAIDRAKDGDVIVIDAGGSDVAVWGELASWSAKLKGVRGVVIDGAIRDIDGIIDMEFPVFARLVVPDAGEPKGYGGIGQEIVCCGQIVRSGDWIIGDENGVIVVAQEQAVEVANRALDVMERENRIREEIKRGSTLSSVQELEKWEQVR